ncbi:MAG: hypothetical protein H0V82_12070 [Candidatus Protochlamydia sp.]|nr:hypothetical protein [Candidatus Protochlamydia sp.]
MKLSKWILSSLLIIRVAHPIDLKAEMEVFPKCILAPDGSGVIIWSGIDISGKTIIQAANRSASGILSNIFTISDDVTGTSVINSKPMLYSNGNGDVVVIWQFFDVDLFGTLVASMLPFGETIWNSQVISNNLEDVQNIDEHRLAINNNGNVLLTWSSVNRSDRTIKKVWISDTTIGTSPIWNTKQNIIP